MTPVSLRLVCRSRSMQWKSWYLIICETGSRRRRKKNEEEIGVPADDKQPNVTLCHHQNHEIQWCRVEGDHLICKCWPMHCRVRWTIIGAPIGAVFIAENPIECFLINRFSIKLFTFTSIAAFTILCLLQSSFIIII